MIELLTCGIVCFLTCAGIKFYRRWSLRRELFDVPNERSSHTVPTPRGGGLIIVLVCLSAYIIAANFRTGDFRWSYLIGATLIALVSWLDDLYTISFVWRFLIHALAAGILILTLGYFDEISLPLIGDFNFGIWGAGLTFLWIVWLTNAYNFMDGIDGIAGAQALTAGIGWLITGHLAGISSVGLYGGIIASSAIGFLIWNWQPAKIFMGDIGSAFLGYTFAALPLLAKSELPATSQFRKFLLPAAVVLMWLFAFDTLWTFGRRVVNREKVWEAHRGHLYQKLVIAGRSHGSVSAVYALLSAFSVTLLILFLKFRSPLTEILLVGWIVLHSGGLLLLAFNGKIRKKGAADKLNSSNNSLVKNK